MNNCSEPISFETAKTILEIMKSNICIISNKNENITLGFFCRIPFPDDKHPLTILITNSQYINKIGSMTEEEEKDYLSILENQIDLINSIYEEYIEKLEEAIEEYSIDYGDIIDKTIKSIKDEKYANLLIATNYQADAPAFTNSQNYIVEKNKGIVL